MSDARSTLSNGIVALTKTLLLVVGTPTALWHLWFLVGAGGRLWSFASLEHVLVIAVGELWGVASADLFRQITVALRSPISTTPVSSWSTRWAASVVGLLLFFGSTSLPLAPAADAAPVSPHPTAVVGLRQAANEIADTGVSTQALDGVLAAMVLQRSTVLKRLSLGAHDGSIRDDDNNADIEQVEFAFRSRADPGAVDALDRSMRLLWHVFQDREQRAPTIRLARVNASCIELFVTDPEAMPPLPFRRGQSEQSWELDRGVLLRIPSAVINSSGRFVAALVYVGHDAQAQYFVIPHVRSGVGIIGDERPVDEVMRSIALQLRCAPWADELDVELAGISPPPVEERCFQCHVATRALLDELADEGAHNENRLSSTWSRSRLVVVDRSFALAGLDVSKLAFSFPIVVTGARQSTTLVLGKQGARIEPDGYVLSPAKVTVDAYRGVEEFFRTIQRRATASREGRAIAKAHHAAVTASDRGAYREAHYAIKQGLMVEPACELLVRDLMGVAHREGDGEAIIRSFAELKKARRTLGDESTSDLTAMLYWSLVNRLDAGRS